MRLEQLQQFIELSKFNSFNQAATHLNITAQALGTSIAKMEEELELTLITRDSRGFSFTENGNEFLVLAKSTLDHYYEGLNKIKNVSSVNYIKGRIAIFGSGIIQELILPEIMPLFKKSYPNITFAIHSAANSEVPDILERNYTYADENKIGFFYTSPFIEAQLKAKNFITVPILNNQPIAVVSQSSSLAKRNSISLTALKKHNLVLATLDPSFPERMGLPKNQSVALATDNMALWSQTITENDYVGILASSFLGDSKMRTYTFLQRLVPIKIKESLPFTLAMAIHKTPSAAVQEFSDFLITHYAVTETFS